MFTCFQQEILSFEQNTGVSAFIYVNKCNFWLSLFWLDGFEKKNTFNIILFHFNVEKSDCSSFLLFFLHSVAFIRVVL